MENGNLFDETFLSKLERLALLSRRAAVGQLQGERRSPKRGYSVEFADFRPYVPGDDFRRIDWNAYARLERFFIKLFVEEEDLTVHFLIDVSQSMDWGQPNKLQFSARAAGAIAYVALVGLDRITINTWPNRGSAHHNQIAPLRGKHNAVKLFSFLQAITSETLRSTRQDPAAWLSAYAANAGHPGPLLLFSDLMHDAWQAGLNSLAARGFEITVLHVLSPDELDPESQAAPPLNGDYKLLDVETDRGVEITADFSTLERYRQYLADWRENWRLFCRARNIHYVPVASSLSIEDLLFTWLRRQGVLR
jgi:uncharacterized protein (DUF58 family)